MELVYTELSESEWRWVEEQRAGAREFAREYDPEAGNGDAVGSLAGLDRALGAYFEADVLGDPNAVINGLGVAFGDALVRELGFMWVIATDDHGPDLALRARPGRGDVTLFPANFVGKRWERREAPFLLDALDETRRRLAEIDEEWKGKG